MRGGFIFVIAVTASSLVAFYVGYVIVLTIAMVVGG